MDYKDISEIKKMYVEGLRKLPEANLKFWDEDYVVDPEMSAEDNAEMVKLHNEKIQNTLNKKGKEKGILNKQIRKEIIKYMMGEYGFSKEKAEYIEAWVRSETRDGTRKGYFDNIEIISDMIVSLPN